MRSFAKLLGLHLLKSFFKAPCGVMRKESSGTTFLGQNLPLSSNRGFLRSIPCHELFAQKHLLGSCPNICRCLVSCSLETTHTLLPQPPLLYFPAYSTSVMTKLPAFNIFLLEVPSQYLTEIETVHTALWVVPGKYHLQRVKERIFWASKACGQIKGRLSHSKRENKCPQSHS